MPVLSRWGGATHHATKLICRESMYSFRGAKARSNPLSPQGRSVSNIYGAAMNRNAVKALSERLQDDPAFKIYLMEAEASLLREFERITDAQPGGIPEPVIRELIGQLRTVRHLRRELLGERKNAGQ